MSETAQKCDKNVIFKQNFTHKLFGAFKIAHSCLCSKGENLDFVDFLQSFLT